VSAGLSGPAAPRGDCWSVLTPTTSLYHTAHVRRPSGGLRPPAPPLSPRGAHAPLRGFACPGSLRSHPPPDSPLAALARRSRGFPYRPAPADSVRGLTSLGRREKGQLTHKPLVEFASNHGWLAESPRSGPYPDFRTLGSVAYLLSLRFVTRVLETEGRFTVKRYTVLVDFVSFYGSTVG
jgi:hypothetical protein